MDFNRDVFLLQFNFFLKFRFHEKKQKSLKKSPLALTTNTRGRFFQILWTSHNFLTLCWHTDKNIFDDSYNTANFYPMKTMGTGNCGVPAGKTCTIYGKGLYRLGGNPMTIIGAIGTILIMAFLRNLYSPFP